MKVGIKYKEFFAVQVLALRCNVFSFNVKVFRYYGNFGIVLLNVILYVEAISLIKNKLAKFFLMLRYGYGT